MVYGLWHWLKMREHHLNIYNSSDTSFIWQIENVMAIFFSCNKIRNTGAIETLEQGLNYFES